MKPVVDRLRLKYEGQMDFHVYPTLEQDPQGNNFAEAHGVRAVPTMVLVSPDGKELRRWVGSQAETELDQAFGQALGTP